MAVTVAVLLIGAIALAAGPLLSSSKPGVAGAGTVLFAANVNTDTLDLVGEPKTYFGPSDTFAYRAVLAEPANTSTLRLVFAKRQASGSEQVMIDQTTSVADPSFQIFANEMPMSTLTPYFSGPGEYVLRVFRGSTVLAQGAFALTP